MIFYCILYHKNTQITKVGHSDILLFHNNTLNNQNWVEYFTHSNTLISKVGHDDILLFITEIL